VIVDPPVIGTGCGAQLDPAVRRLEELDLFGAMLRQPILQIDPGKRGRQLAQIAWRRTDQTAELAEAP
jgi:hypothetical protein